jgi:hypothetical protein
MGSPRSKDLRNKKVFTNYVKSYTLIKIQTQPSYGRVRENPNFNLTNKITFIFIFTI